MRRLLLAWLVWGIGSAALAAGNPYAGIYRSHDVVIEIRGAGAGRFTGTIQSQGQAIPFTARETGSALVGNFTVDGEKIEFHATLQGTTLTFATEDESYLLTREGTRAPAARKGTESTAAGKKMAPSARATQARPLRINRVIIGEDQVRKFEQEHRIRIPGGDFWYDQVSGAWGLDGGPTIGFTTPGMRLGGPLPADASRGDTGVFINGRELPLADVVGLQQINVPVARGRWWVDSGGNFGVEGTPLPLGNLFQFSRGKAGAYNRATAGGYIGSDGQTSYFFDPKTGSSVVTGN